MIVTIWNDVRYWANADAKPLERLSVATKNLGAPTRLQRQTDYARERLQSATAQSRQRSLHPS
jgi:hypothetical protein